jgi:CYTH domain-containing protein
MSATRRFLLASSLARLIGNDRGGQRVSEGHFPVHDERSVHVQVEEHSGSLVLIAARLDAPVEERAELPRAQAEALRDVAAGRVDYLRSDLSIGTREVQISRFIMPGPLDLISVGFAHAEEARHFQPLPWFGPEVTADASYQTRMIALEGAPEAPEAPVSDAAVNDLLDILDNRFGSAIDQILAEVTSAPPQAVLASAAGTSMSATAAEDGEDLSIDDRVIRGLAHALRPRPRLR